VLAISMTTMADKSVLPGIPINRFLDRMVSDSRPREKPAPRQRICYNSLWSFSQLQRRSSMLSGLRQFLLRGNVLDLAVAVVIGAAFGAMVTALVKDIITPLIGAIVGTPDFSAWQFEINGSRFLIGDFINAVVSFLLIGTAVYFFVVAPMNAFIARMRRGEPTPDPTTKKCPECMSEVPIAARRCAFCTSVLEGAATR
jgi:large conductance mechanosensitive channel